MSNTQNRTTTRRPRLSVAVRTRIVQLRASDEEHPPSLDRIHEKLEDEGWDPLPSRGSVQNVVRAWEEEQPDIRARDLPFQWHQLDRARIPWEASEWIMDVLYERAWQLTQDAAWWEETPEVQEMISLARYLHRDPFTNRLATWSWRLHQAAPDLNPAQVLAFAHRYAFEEQAHDIVGDGAPMQLERYDAWLTFRPYRGDLDEQKKPQTTYDDSIRIGLAPALPDSFEPDSFERDRKLHKLLRSPGMEYLDMADPNEFMLYL